MRFNATRFACATLSTASILLTTPSLTLAADADLEEIVVTAQKREERLQDVPIAITVVGEEQLAAQHINAIADLARTSPSLEMIQAFGGPGGGGQIRGIGTTSFTDGAEASVGIVVDGVPQGSIPAVNVFDLQRVEVLRGPQGTLFGLTSSAGVINMVTVAPDPTALSGTAHIDYSHKGTAGSKFGQQVMRATVNIPLTETSALRIGATTNTVKGLYTLRTDAQTAHDSKNENTGVRARFRWAPSEDLQVNLIADYNKQKNNYWDPQFVYVELTDTDANLNGATGLKSNLAACGIVASYDNRSRCAQGDNYKNDKNYGFSAQVDWTIPLGTLTSISGYRKDTDGPNSVDIQAVPLESPQIHQLGTTARQRQFSQELRIASPQNQRVEYTTGLFYSDYQNRGTFEAGEGFTIDAFIPGLGFQSVSRDASPQLTTNKSWAVFGQTTTHLSEELGLIVGARYTSQKVRNTVYENAYAGQAGFTGPYASLTAPETVEINKSNVSGKLGLQYKFTPGLNGYVTAARGYKGPQIQARTATDDAILIQPEIPTTYELGIKGSVGALGLDMSVFQSKVKNYQGQSCKIRAQGNLACTPNAVEITSKGVELGVYGRVFEGLSLNGGVIYNVAKYPSGYTGYDLNNLNGGQTDLGDKQIVGVPKTKFTLAGEYSHALGAIEGFFGADTVYKSATRMGFSADERLVYHAHWMTGLRTGVRDSAGKWAVELFARNVGDEHEPVTLYGGPAFYGPGTATPGPGQAGDTANLNGYVKGISGWWSPASFRQVGLSLDAKF